MKLTSQQYAQALYEAVNETNPKDHDLILDKFVKILAEKGDLAKYSDIENAYANIERNEKGIREVNVTFAQEHNTKILDDLNKVVQGKAEFKTNLDAGIIGGVVVRVDDTLIDASVKTKLENLNRQLKI